MDGRMRLFLVLVLPLFFGCSSSLKVDVRCFAYPQSGVIVIDCGDMETWGNYEAQALQRQRKK